ncbi:5071_t:CDS:2 [Dentiscutata heterogama]|uniref:5071_t:CDS:1 n=1 Tax=Dentiscutata heterogama TaxID=1316150 RepID=A0ACA9M4L7_9GLOM|nr:5071_t:CDS:2 [Dentiscutata heterogama]
MQRGPFLSVCRVAKSGYLSTLNNLKVFQMHDKKFADCFRFTEDEISIILQHNNKEDQLDDKKVINFTPKSAINVKILEDIDYNTLSPRASDVIWTLLYYEDYLTMNEDKNLYIKDTEVFTEWKEWLNNRNSSNPDTC